MPCPICMNIRTEYKWGMVIVQKVVIYYDDKICRYLSMEW